MKKLNMEKVIARYNLMMENCCYEHSTINTEFSEGTENWNLRDMVAEADYLLQCYHESGNSNYEFRLDSAEDYKAWLSCVGKLKRFIARYEPYIEDMICAENHCSDYDNAD